MDDLDVYSRSHGQGSSDVVDVSRGLLHLDHTLRESGRSYGEIRLRSIRTLTDASV